MNNLRKFCQQNLVGLDREIDLLIKAIENNIPVVIEGESGTGKTELVKTVAKAMDNRPVYRVDGDENLNINTLRGWFDPPLVLEKGFCDEAFIPGPLISAIREGGIFFFNEVNRAPSETINGVLSVMDERIIHIPKLGIIKAHDNFFAVFTQNPTEYVGTNPLPEAFYDRCIYLKLTHKSGEEAKRIVKMRTGCNNDTLISITVQLVDNTRSWFQFRQGSSIRGAIQVVQMLKNEPFNEKSFKEVAIAVLSKKVKLHAEINLEVEVCLANLIKKTLNQFNNKKKN